MKYPYIIIFLIISQSLLAQTTTLYQYDNLNRLIQTEYPDGTIETFTYDEVGNRLSCIITGTATVDLYFVAQSLANSTLSAGESSNLSFTLGNNGNAAAAAQKTYFYLSTDTQYDTGDSEVGCQYVSGIAAMGNAPYTTTIQIPSATTGTYYLLLVADGEEQVTESDEDNNVAYIPITISDDAQANLVVQNASISPTTVAVGSSSSIDFDIANIGTADAAATTFKVYLSDDLTWDGNDSELTTATQSIPMLTANNSQAFSGTVSIPANTVAGTYYLLFYADAQQTQTESDEGDNIVPVAITITDDGAAAPMAAFTADLTDICVGQSIMFHDASSNQPTAWAWSFEGGEPVTSNASNPSVTYHQAGTYSVSLTVTNAEGNDNLTSVGYVTVGSGGGGAAPSWEWISHPSSTNGLTRFLDTYIDNVGNSYLIGYFSGTITWDGITLNANNNKQGFIFKVGADGNLLWGRQYGQDEAEEFIGILVDDDGYIYLTGTYDDHTNIGGLSTSTASSATAVFFVKLDPTGTTASWIETINTTSVIEAYDIAVDGNDLYIAGTFIESCTFEAGMTLNSIGDSDIFLAKYNQNTNTFEWARRAGGSDYFDYPRGLAIRGNNIYVGGIIDGNGTFQNGPNFTSNGNYDAFIAQYTTTGNVVWVEGIGGSYSDFMTQMIITETGEIYLSGTFRGSASFGSLTVNTLHAVNVNNGFIAKMNSSGTFLWVKRLASTDNNAASVNDICLDENGNIYATGSCNGLIQFEDFVNDNTYGYIDLYALKCDTDGNLIWLKDAGGNGSEVGNTIQVDNNGYIYIQASIEGVSTVFDDITVSSNQELVAKLVQGEDCNLTVAITPNGSTTLCPNQSVELTAPSGYTYQWSTGETTQNINVTQAGDYTVTITDCSGCTAVSDPVQVSVGGESEPLNFYTSNENCYNQDGVLGYLMPNRTQNVQVSWNGGSQTFQANQNVELTGLSAGTYYTTITDYLACVYEDVVMINRTGNLPMVAFMSTVNDKTVTFDNQSTDAANYVWYLGDGSTSTDVHPIHTYAEYGTYNVCVSASNACGNNVTCQSITVEDPALCLFVTNTNDAGPGSLRAALDCANLRPGPDTIRFDLANIDPFIITLLSELPPIENDGTVIIGDNTTPPQFRLSDSKIELDGSQLFNQENGLTIKGNNIEIYGLHIHSFPAHGIFLNSANNTIIGGTASYETNIIAHNQWDGINTTIGATNNRFYQNSIFCNGEKGIDHDFGNKASPIISTATENTITGTATAGDRIEVFEHDITCIGCQGKTFLGATIADINGDWTWAGVFTIGQNITAIASDTNNTSEFSTCAMVEGSLPLEQLTFQATPQQQSIQLTWRSTLEINLQQYNILRSTDGQHFEKIGQQVAQNKAAASYTFTDRNVSPNQLYYYQLQIVEEDGTTSKSPIRTAQIKSLENVVIYPNPTTGMVYMEGFSLEETVQIKVYDSLGRLVKKIAKKTGDITIDMNAFHDGVYLFDIQQMGQSRILEKIVLLR